jgi:hypothetical protein
MAWLMDHYLVILLDLSEVLPLIPGLEANSIGQLVLGLIKQLLADKPAK